MFSSSKSSRGTNFRINFTRKNFTIIITNNKLLEGPSNFKVNNEYNIYEM